MRQFDSTAAAQFWCDDEYPDTSQVILLCVVADDGEIVAVSHLRELGSWAECRGV